MITVFEARKLEALTGDMRCKVCGKLITNRNVRIACFLEGKAYCETHMREWKVSQLEAK